MQIFDNGKTFRLSLFAMFLSAGITLSFIESVYLPPLAIPGAKLGIASIVTLLMIIFFSTGEVIAASVLRVLIVNVFSGLIFTPAFVFSFFASLGSTIIMLLIYRFFRSLLSFVGISMVGAVSHNLIQMLIAIPLLQTTAVLVHLPFLIVIGCITGIINGTFANLIAARQDIKYLIYARLRQE